MQHTRHTAAAFAVMVSFASVFGALYGGGATGSHAERPAAGVPDEPAAYYAPSFVDGAVATGAIDDEIALSERALEDARIEAERIEAERLAELARIEEAAKVAAARALPVPARNGCCGPHSDAWWHGVAICEQGGRNDPYFGYFSFMDGSAGGKTWDEQVAMGNALLARAGREVGPWAASCVAAGYAASPSG